MSPDAKNSGFNSARNELPQCRIYANIVCKINHMDCKKCKIYKKMTEDAKKKMSEMRRPK